MLARAAALCDEVSRGFDFVRVDLYLSGDGDAQRLYLGELTPYPMRGRHHWWGDPNLNEELGAQWCVPPELFPEISPADKAILENSVMFP